jgi:WD40 repeat protein/tRNA A-37 threonylcarbamoyl transferase component Bud32
MASIPAPLKGDDKSREERLHEVIADYLEAIEAGTAPDRSAILAREPDLAAELADFFANEDHLARVAACLRGQGTGAVLRLTDGGEDDATGVVPQLLPFSLGPDLGAEPADGRSAPGSEIPWPSPRQVRYFGDYELQGVIAQGGMGIVYLARQVSLNRVLAIKMVRAGRLATADDLVRFRLEAEAAAHLDHPHIVPIYEVGEHEGHHYFSMKLIEGGNLATEADRFRSNPRAAAHLIATVAKAVHYAHQRGILHRDLKPANILLCGSGDDPADRLIPVVTDFGLAKRVEAPDSGGVTSSGSIVGTPSYMAPEQAEGRREAVTTAADIHALGAILYELLLGRPPFRGDSVMETLHQVRELEPTAPRLIDPRVPRDLETIVLKCLEKRPVARYHSAEDLAEDLERWISGLPIRARAATPLERLVKWVRRRPAVAALFALAGVATFASALAIRSLRSAAQLETDVARTGQALDSETRKRVEAESQLVDMEDESYFKQLVAAERAWERNEPATADRLLDYCPPRLRGWEWHHLRRRFHSELQTFQGHNPYLCGTVFRPDGTQVACAAEPTGFLLWETAKSQVVRRIPGHDGTIYGLAFNQAGTRMASALASGQVRVWDLTSGRSLCVLRGHEGWVSGVAFSGDGLTLASAGQDGTIRLWMLGKASAADSVRPALILRGHDGPVFGVAFSSDGHSLASAGHDGTVRLWSLRKGLEGSCRVLRGHQEAVRCVVFHPRENLLASAGADRTVRVWDGATGEERLHFGEFDNRVDGIAFDPEGNRIATACLDRSVRVWDARTGRPMASFPGHSAPVFSVTFSPDGTRLASASQDATVKVWDLTSEPGARLLSLPPCEDHREAHGVAWVGGLSFRPGGAELAGAGVDQALAVWNLESGRARFERQQGESPLTAVRYSPDGRLLASACVDRGVRIVDAGSLRETMVLGDGKEGPVSLAFDPTGPILATGSGYPPAVLQLPMGKGSPPEGRARSIRLWDLKTGAALGSLQDHVGSIHAIIFTPDGSRLISAGLDRLVRIWDPKSGRLLQKLEGHSGAIYALAVRPDGRQIASAGDDKSIRVWDLAQGRLVRVLLGHTNWIFGLAYHPGGSRLASAGADRTVRLWEPEGGREILTLRGHRDRAYSVAFSPDGRSLVSASADGAVRVWETDLEQTDRKPGDSALAQWPAAGR